MADYRWPTIPVAVTVNGDTFDFYRKYFPRYAELRALPE